MLGGCWSNLTPALVKSDKANQCLQIFHSIIGSVVEHMPWNKQAVVVSGKLPPSMIYWLERNTNPHLDMLGSGQTYLRWVLA